MWNIVLIVLVTLAEVGTIAIISLIGMGLRAERCLPVWKMRLEKE